MAQQKVSIIAVLLAIPLLLLDGGMCLSSEAAGLTHVAKNGNSQASHHANAKGHHQPGPPKHAPAHGYRSKHMYHYYPGNNVYYDLERKLYFYMDGDTWKTNVSLPESIRLNLGKSTSIELDTDLPYRALTKD